MKLRSAARTDIGRVRKANEDRFLCDDGNALYGIADGIGGLPCGDLAASCAVEAVSRFIAKNGKGTLKLQKCVEAANSDVLAQSRTASPAYGMGTTLVFGVLREDRLQLAHVGDSRCFLFREGTLRCLTTDHNVENDARLRAARGEAVTVKVTERNRAALTRCIGQNTTPEADLLSEELRAGDRVLFCSDGIYRLVEETEMAEMIAAASEPGDALEKIISAAIQRGGFDNATGVLLMLD